MNEKWKCMNCEWKGPRHEIIKIEYFAQTELEPSEWLWHCPECNLTEVVEDPDIWCDWCDDIKVSDEGEVCAECRTCQAEELADRERGH